MDIPHELSHLMGLQASAHNTLAAGIGTFGYVPNVSSIFGIPRAISVGGVAMDVPMTLLNSVNAQNPGEAIYAIKALQKASAHGQRIYQLTKANQSTTLSNVHHDSATMQKIQDVLNAGKEVITHTDAVSVPGWSREWGIFGYVE